MATVNVELIFPSYDVIVDTGDGHGLCRVPVVAFVNVRELVTVDSPLSTGRNKHYI